MSSPAQTPTPIPKSLFSIDALFDNPVFAGGAGVVGLGAAAALARRGLLRSASLIKRRLLVDLEISKQDESYQWILGWLAIPRPSSGFIASRITRVHHLSMKTIVQSVENGPTHARFMGQHGYGKHIIRYKNAYIAVDRAKSTTSNMKTGEPHETVTLTTLFAHRHIFEDIFTEAHQLAKSAQEGKTVMYSADTSLDWSVFGNPRRKRPIESVILDEGIKERIVADVKDFMESQKWYVDRGIPYRRGYLLYGPPGSGKSSFIQALAGDLDFGVAIINLSQRGMTDDRLVMLLTKLPKRTILLLEDADAAFRNRRQAEADGYKGASVTFSGLLNAMDGVAAGEERIAFLTTNHIDQLDPALIRPGRVDMTVRIGGATRHQAAEMWDRFYGDIDKENQGRKRFLQKLETLDLIAPLDSKTGATKWATSMAAIQGLFLFNKNDMDGAIKHAEGLIPRTYEPEPQDQAGLKVPA